jgi:hypothetical protein
MYGSDIDAMIIAKKSNSDESRMANAICHKCFHQLACEFELNADGRCLFYINDDLVKSDNRVRKDSAGAFTIDEEVIEKIVKKLSP